ncbi:hypothetical protein B0T13DRAFT_452809 [Neurospora crassa]|nr:hypothetical protein B0T13DRAFT_452809 [Neurospora crassa]
MPASSTMPVQNAGPHGVFPGVLIRGSGVRPVRRKQPRGTAATPVHKRLIFLILGTPLYATIQGLSHKTTTEVMTTSPPMLDIDAGTITTYREPGASVTVRVTVSAGTNDEVTDRE